MCMAQLPWPITRPIQMASSKPLLAQFAFLYTFGHFQIEIEREEVESEAEAYDPFQYACKKKDSYLVRGVMKREGRYLRRRSRVRCYLCYL